MSTINKAAASMQTPADYTPRKEDFALLEQHDIATDKNFASQGYWKGVAIHFFRNKRAVTGLVIVLLIVFFNIKIDRSFAFVSKSGIQNFLHKINLFHNMPRCVRFNTWGQYV